MEARGTMPSSQQDYNRTQDYNKEHPPPPMQGRHLMLGGPQYYKTPPQNYNMSLIQDYNMPP